MPRAKKAKRADAPVVEGKSKPSDKKRKTYPIGICVDCHQEREIRCKDRCTRCYPVYWRKARWDESADGQKVRRVRVPGAGDVAIDSVELVREMSEISPLSPSESDQIVIRAASGDSSTDQEALIKPSLGHQKIWIFLRRFDHYFRRQIISQMQSLGMGRLDIIAAFVANSKLRKRWIDPLRNPMQVLDHDFKILAKNLRPKRTSGDALKEHIEYLRLLKRLALDIASDGGSAATVRKEMLTFSAKLARDSALLEDAIRVNPSLGDVASPKALLELQRQAKVAAGQPESAETASEEADEDEEAATMDQEGGYTLPQIE